MVFAVFEQNGVPSGVGRFGLARFLEVRMARMFWVGAMLCRSSQTGESPAGGAPHSRKNRYQKEQNDRTFYFCSSDEMHGGQNCSRKGATGNHKHQTASCIPIVRLCNVLFFFENGDIDGIEFTISIKICGIMIHGNTSLSFSLANHIFVNSSAMGVSLI
jgi:hypothetical protein